MQALCGLQGIFDLFNCKTPGCSIWFWCRLYSERDSFFRKKSDILTLTKQRMLL